MVLLLVSAENRKLQEPSYLYYILSFLLTIYHSWPAAFELGFFRPAFFESRPTLGPPFLAFLESTTRPMRAFLPHCTLDFLCATARHS